MRSLRVRAPQGSSMAWPGRQRYSGLAPENFTTFAHLSVSSTKSLPKSAGDVGNTAEPSSAYRALILGSARPALISQLSLSTISGGVLPGAPTPNHRFDS